MKFFKIYFVLTFICGLCFSSLMTEAIAKTICVSQVQARLRAQPSTNAQLQRVVFENTPLVQISKRGRWIEVRDYANKKHFIFDSLISNERECLMVLGGGRTYLEPDPSSQHHKERSLVHHLEGLQIIKKDLGYTKVLDRFGNEFWISSETRVWPTEL